MGQIGCGLIRAWEVGRVEVKTDCAMWKSGKLSLIQAWSPG